MSEAPHAAKEELESFQEGVERTQYKDTVVVFGLPKGGYFAVRLNPVSVFIH